MVRIVILFVYFRGERERGDHDNALNAEILGINSFYMDIGLDNYRGARTSKLPNCSNWSRSCSRLGLGQGVPQFSRKESKG